MGRWRRTALVIATATLGFVSAADPALARDSGCRAHAAKRDSGCVPDRMSGTINGSNDNFSWTGVVTMDDREPSVAGTIDVHWQLSGSARAENADLDEGCVPLKTEGSATVEVRMTWEEDPLDEDQWDYYIDSNTIDPDVEYECKHGRSSIEGINLIVPIAVGNGKTRALSSVSGNATFENYHSRWSWSLVGSSSRAPDETSDNGIDFIEREEAFRSHAYNDSAGYCTIGYGTLLLPKHSCNARDRQRRVTEKQAEAQLKASLHRFEADVTALQTGPQTKLTQCQFDALASFRYNVSAASWSSLSRAIKSKGLAAVPAELQKYVKAKDIDTGKYTTKNELVSRRKSEAALFGKNPCPCGGLPPAARRPYYS